MIQSDSDFVYNIITAAGINFLSFLHRAKQAWSQGLLIIYVTQIRPKLHLCGLFCVPLPEEIICQPCDGFKYMKCFFFFSKVKQNMYNKSVVEIRVMAVYLAPVILYKYTRSKLENAKEHSRQALRKRTSFSGLHEALTCW